MYCLDKVADDDFYFVCVCVFVFFACVFFFFFHHICKLSPKETMHMNFGDNLHEMSDCIFLKRKKNPKWSVPAIILTYPWWMMQIIFYRFYYYYRCLRNILYVTSFR